MPVVSDDGDCLFCPHCCQGGDAEKRRRFEMAPTRREKLLPVSEELEGRRDLHCDKLCHHWLCSSARRIHRCWMDNNSASSTRLLTFRTVTFSAASLCHKVKRRGRRRISKAPVVSAEDHEADQGSECYTEWNDSFLMSFCCDKSSCFLPSSIKAHPKKDTFPHNLWIRRFPIQKCLLGRW